jgi:hypothetical protein
LQVVMAASRRDLALAFETPPVSPASRERQFSRIAPRAT